MVVGRVLGKVEVDSTRKGIGVAAGKSRSTGQFMGQLACDRRHACLGMSIDDVADAVPSEVDSQLQGEIVGTAEVVGKRERTRMAGSKSAGQRRGAVRGTIW